MTTCFLRLHVALFLQAIEWVNIWVNMSNSALYEGLRDFAYTGF